MIGKRMKQIRKEKGYTLEELGKLVGKSPSVLSRMETQDSYTVDPKFLEKLADVLGVSIIFLLSEEVTHYENMEKIKKLEAREDHIVRITDDEMSPEIPEGSFLYIRGLYPREKLQIGSYYIIAFNGQKKVRMAIEDKEDGLGFMPLSMSERRIAYDRKYVEVLGKVISMKVFFNDKVH